MKLLIIRHGEASNEGTDDQRRLTERGRMAVAKIAGFIAGRQDLRIETIFHSAKARARETAEIIAGTLKHLPKMESAEGLKPNDDPMHWLKKSKICQDDTILVSHLPLVELLTAGLVGINADYPVFNFQTATVVCLERAGVNQWCVLWMLSPDNLP